MKKQTVVSVVLGTLLGLVPMQAHALRCELWDLLNVLVTPLPVNDGSSMGALTVTQIQQVIESVEAGIQNVTKELKLQKWSAMGSNLSKKLSEVSVPKMEDFTKGSETAVEAFKGQFAGKTLSTGNVDFTGDKDVSKAVEEVAVVSNPVDSAERQAEIERKNAFIQQAVLDLSARILFYKSELAELKAADSSAQSTSGSGDTTGSHDISMQMKDANARVQALQEKVTAARLELLAIQNLKAAKPVQEKINVKGDS